MIHLAFDPIGPKLGRVEFLWTGNKCLRKLFINDGSGIRYAIFSVCYYFIKVHFPSNNNKNMYILISAGYGYTRGL